MPTTTIELTKEEIVQRGQEIYEREIKSLVEADYNGRVVAIDVRTGEFEVAIDAITSAQQLRIRQPEAIIFVQRVGSSSLHRIR